MSHKALRPTAHHHGRPAVRTLCQDRSLFVYPPYRSAGRTVQSAGDWVSRPASCFPPSSFSRRRRSISASARMAYRVTHVRRREAEKLRGKRTCHRQWNFLFTRRANDLPLKPRRQCFHFDVLCSALRFDCIRIILNLQNRHHQVRDREERSKQRILDYEAKTECVRPRQCGVPRRTGLNTANRFCDACPVFEKPGGTDERAVA